MTPLVGKPVVIIYGMTDLDLYLYVNFSIAANIAIHYGHLKYMLIFERDRL